MSWKKIFVLVKRDIFFKKVLFDFKLKETHIHILFLFSFYLYEKKGIIIDLK